MLEIREIEGTDLVEIEVDGRIDRADFERVAARLEQAIRAHGQVRVLEVVHGFSGIDPATLLADLKFSLRHLTHFSRAAVVSDLTWLRALATVAGKVMPAEVRVFRLVEIDAARAWLNQTAPAETA